MAPPAIMQVFKAFMQSRGKLSDIEFMSVKAFGGKTRTNRSSVSGATGTVATLTANASKDMYLGFATISVRRSDVSNSSENATVELVANTTTVEVASFNINSGTTSAGYAAGIPYEFKWKGFVDAAQVIKLVATTVGTNIVVHGMIECFEEADGDSPQI